MIFDPSKVKEFSEFINKTQEFKVDIQRTKDDLWAKVRKKIPPEYRHRVTEDIFVMNGKIKVTLIYKPLGE